MRITVCQTLAFPTWPLSSPAGGSRRGEDHSSAICRGPTRAGRRGSGSNLLAPLGSRFRGTGHSDHIQDRSPVPLVHRERVHGIFPGFVTPSGRAEIRCAGTYCLTLGATLPGTLDRLMMTRESEAAAVSDDWQLLQAEHLRLPAVTEAPSTLHVTRFSTSINSRCTCSIGWKHSTSVYGAVGL